MYYRIVERNKEWCDFYKIETYSVKHSHFGHFWWDDNFDNRLFNNYNDALNRYNELVKNKKIYQQKTEKVIISSYRTLFDIIKDYLKLFFHE